MIVVKTLVCWLFDARCAVAMGEFTLCEGDGIYGIDAAYGGILLFFPGTTTHISHIRQSTNFIHGAV